MANFTEETFVPQVYELLDHKSAYNISSGIYLILIALVTITANGLLLIGLYKNENGSLRRPSTVFICNLLGTGLIAGAVSELLLAIAYLSSYAGDHTSATLNLTMAAKVIRSVCVVVSILTAVGFSWTFFAPSQSIPKENQSEISSKECLMSIIAYWIYAILFFTLASAIATWELYLKLELHLNFTVCLVLTVLTYLSLWVYYMNRRTTVDVQFDTIADNAQIREQRRLKHQLLFVICFLVVIDISCVTPYFIYQHVLLYTKMESIVTRQRTLIVERVIEVILCHKFILEPILLVWRLPDYRRALVSVFVS
ncbi:uncharacterized protein LOC116601221 [Nematostella vectensis]|uniref:uncharacterized protein LOC116601221 n=1 Tax=Nematostella vectensis TaxID=45351 RepID=UPI002077358A|nr:uncharacterized protein LOC116601221 [Nematostella vectensis]